MFRHRRSTKIRKNRGKYRRGLEQPGSRRLHWGVKIRHYARYDRHVPKMKNSYAQGHRGWSSSLLSLPGRVLWRGPLPFQMAKLFGPPYSLRSLVFHDISDGLSPFTRGLGVSIAPEEFERIINFVCRYYSPLQLKDYIDNRAKGSLPERPILITFDDAYASVARNAAPILQKCKVPAVFFVNSGLVGNRELATDNLLCYVANVRGVETLRSLARPFATSRNIRLDSLEDVLDNLFPAMSQRQVAGLRERLVSAAGLSSANLAEQANLYVSAEQLRTLTSSGFEIGSHTTSHVFCRTLTPTELDLEIDDNNKNLKVITGANVTTFSVPYGGPADFTKELAERLRSSGHETVFLARDRANSATTDLYRLNRINIHSGTEARLFGEIEVLPRLRSLADIVLRRNGT